jgi:hypothetical protein
VTPLDEHHSTENSGEPAMFVQVSICVQLPKCALPLAGKYGMLRGA